MKIWINTLFNAMGLVIPTVLAIPAMGYLARQLEVERFGVFLLIFTLLGFSSIFDLGITRAVILRVAKNKNDNVADGKVMGTALVSVLILSTAVFGLTFLFSETITKYLKVSDSNFADVSFAIKVMAFSIPITILNLVGFSLLEGRQLFLKLNIFKIFTGISIAVLPAIFVFGENSLSSAILGIFFARLLTLFITAKLCLSILERGLFVFKKSVLMDLLKFGGWITVSNAISALMSSADRFIISNALGAKQAAFYSAPADAIARLGIVPGALAKAIFPFFGAKEDFNKSIYKIYAGLSFLLIFLLIPSFIFSKEIFSIWLGAEIAVESSMVFRVLVIGFFFNSLAQIPFSKIQAEGRSDITAKIHILEIVPYFALLFFLMDKYGVIGAAYAWSIRVIIDFCMLEYMKNRGGK